MKTIAIIIARGGSKRVPRKNVRPICGLPLVAWSVIQATCSRRVDHVYVSTDDDEIEQISRAWGADVIRRPDWPDADQASGGRPYLHAIDVLEDQHGMDYCMVQVLPTSPQRLPNDIDRGVEKWHETTGHVIASSPRGETFLHHNVRNTISREAIADKYGNYMDPASGLFNAVSPSWYRWFVPRLGTDLDAGRNEQYLSGEHMEKDFYFVECQPWQVFEVDTPGDFELTEQLFEHFVLKGRGPGIYYDYAGISQPVGVLAGNWRQQ